MWELVSKNPAECNLGDIVYLSPVRSSCYGVNILACRRSLLWNNFQSDIKQSNNLEEFKLKLSNLRNILYMCCVQGVWKSNTGIKLFHKEFFASSGFLLRQSR